MESPRIALWRCIATCCLCLVAIHPVQGRGSSDVCEEMPCGPFGNCVPTKVGPNYFKCECAPGFKWTPDAAGCTEEDLCTPNPCGANSTCSMNGGGIYECTCDTSRMMVGYGPHGKLTCVEHTSVCDTNPCGPAGLCTPSAAHSGNYSCECMPGYAQKGATGYCLEIDNPCKGNPCRHRKNNGNKCVHVLGGGYRCICGPNYYLPPRFKKAGGTCFELKEKKIKKKSKKDKKSKKAKKAKKIKAKKVKKTHENLH